MRPVRPLSTDRQAGVRVLADLHVQRHLAEERHAEALGLVARAAVAENVRSRAALRAQEIAHVLDDAEHRHIDPLEHGDAAPGIDQRRGPAASTR